MTLDIPNDTPAEPGPPPKPLPGVGAGQSEALKEALHQLLLNASGQLGAVYRARASSPHFHATALYNQYQPAANPSAVSNLLATIDAITNEKYPDSSPSRAKASASSTRSLLKGVSNTEVRTHLEKVLKKLQDLSADPQAEEAELATIKEESKSLDEQLANAPFSGVYVYTYPHYYKHPFEPDTNRLLLKVGCTQTDAWKRVSAQGTSTAAPETPLILRVYLSEDATAVEKKFHRLLDAAQHDRSKGWGSGKEWFSTTLEFLDTIADVLGLESRKAEPQLP